MAGLLDFLQTPQAQGLAAGLLQAGGGYYKTPQTFAGALGQGLQAAEQYKQQDIKNRLDQQKANAYERLGFGNLALREQELGMLGQGKLLDNLYRQMQMEEIRSKIDDRQARSQALQQMFAEGGDYNPDEISEITSKANEYGDDFKRTSEQKRRAATAYALGRPDKAIEILTEKSEKDKTNEPTTTFLTQTQTQVQAIDNLLPAIDELEETGAPSQAFYPGVFNADDQARYDAQKSSIVEQIVSAFGLPKTDSGIKKAETMVGRGTYESLESYKKRLKGLKKDLIERRARISKVSNINKERGNTPPEDPLGIR